MALNIESSEAHRLARALDKARGTNLTEAVTVALKAALEAATASVSADILLAEVSEIQSFVAALPDCDTRTPEAIVGYDDRGLPA